MRRVVRERRPSVRAAVRAVVAHVDQQMRSWRSLNHQVRWILLDEIAAVCGRDCDLSVVQAEMDDRQPWYWQRFMRRTDADRKAEIRKAWRKVQQQAAVARPRRK